MTRKEKEKKLLDALDLKVGDKIKLYQLGVETYKIVELKSDYRLSCTRKELLAQIGLLLLYDFEKVEEE